MKKAILIFALITFPLFAIGQNESVSNVDINSVETMFEKIVELKEAKKEATSNSALKNKVIYINRKKSADIISIKAYRKSLQIKVKTVKLC